MKAQTILGGALILVMASCSENQSASNTMTGDAGSAGTSIAAGGSAAGDAAGGSATAGAAGDAVANGGMGVDAGDPFTPMLKQRPNILFIFTDDHAFQAISAYGSKINQTPNIDRIADAGVTFQRAVVTNSICGPMRAVIQTGKYSHLNGFYTNQNSNFDGSQQTFPKLLQAAGYQTAMIGKWHLGSDPQGFDYWEILQGQGTYYNPRMNTAQGTNNHVGYTTDIITDLAIDWLEGRDANKPFMLMYQHKAPHRSWEPGPEYLNMYDDVTIPEPETLFDDYSGRGTPAHTQDMEIATTLNNRDLKFTPPNNLNAAQLATWNAAYDPKNAEFQAANLTGDDLVRWKYQRYIKDYLRCVASVDDNVGRMLDYLDEKGLADNTLVVYSSDQGFYLGEHGWFDKRWMYEESFRTPLIARWPGVIRPGSQNTDIVSTLDIPETFLDAAGAAVPADMQGASLIPIFLEQRPADWRTTFYYHYYEYPAVHSVRRHDGVADARYKLIHFYEEDVNEWELFDLQEDPHELLSVYGNATYADVQTRLTAELARLRQELMVPAQDGF